MNDDRTALENYLFKPTNSHARESLLNNRLFYDLKLAAAERGYFLQIYHPEVDKDGFDVIFDDGDSLLKVQLKTVMRKAPTDSWSIHKSLLRPDIYICEDLGFEPSPSGTGYQGGIILIDMDVKDCHGIEIDYYYTDIIIISGIKAGIVNLDTLPSQDKVSNVFKGLKTGSSHDRVEVPKSLFLRAKSPSALLALMGLHNAENTTIWRFHIQKMIGCRDERELPAPPEKLKEHINEELASISANVIKP